MNEKLIERFSELAELERLQATSNIFTNDLGEVDYPRLKKSFSSIEFLGDNDFINVSMHTGKILTPPHKHSFVEVFYMCRGQATHIVDGYCKIVQKEGGLLFLSQNVYHEITDEQEDCLGIIFFLKPEFFRYAFDAFNLETSLMNFIFGAMCNSDNKIRYLAFEITNMLPIENLIENMIWSFCNHRSEDFRIIQVSMSLLLLHLNRFCDQCISDTQTDPSYSLTIDVLEYINENYVDGTLSDFAAKHGQSIHSAGRIIKAYTGKTFKELQRAVKLSHAVTLLTTTEFSITDIASAIGYENTSFFYKTFKEFYNMTPYEFRKAHRAKQKADKVVSGPET